MGFSSTLSSSATEAWDLYDANADLNGHDLTESGTITYSTGKIYNAAYLEAANNEYLYIPNASAGDFDLGTGDQWFSCWIYLDSLTSSYQGVYLYGGDGTTSDGTMIAVRSNGRVYAYKSDGTTRLGANTANSTVGTGAWHWICVNYDYDGNMEIYVDDPSTVKGTVDISSLTGSVAPSTDDFEIGGIFIDQLDGRICNVATGIGALADLSLRSELFNSKGGVETSSEIVRDYDGDADVYRVKVTAKSAQIGGTATQVGYPLVITEAECPDELIDSDLSSAEASGAPTLRASTDSAGVQQMGVDIVKFTPASDPANAVVEIWLRPLELDGTNGTDVYLWWESASGKTQPTVPHAYGANAVWPFNHTVAIMQNDYGDSTYRGFDGTGTSMESNSTDVPFGSNESYSFNGTSSRITVSNNSAFNYTDKVTLEYWLKVDTDTGDYQGFAGKRRDTVIHWMSTANLDGGTDLMVGQFYNGGWKSTSATFSTNFSTGTWYHMFVEFEDVGADVDIELFKGTTSVASGTHTSTSLAANSEDITLGAIKTGASTWAFWFDGKIKAFRVVNEIFSADIKTTLHNNQNAPGTFWDSTAAATQPFSTGVTGTGTLTEGGESFSATGTVLVSGTGALTEGGETIAGIGAVLVSGTGTLTEGGETMAGVGLVFISGTGTLTEGGEAFSGFSNLEFAYVTGTVTVEDLLTATVTNEDFLTATVTANP